MAKKYETKWSFKRSRIFFMIQVIAKLLKKKSNPGMAPGIHYIDAPSGGGKTLYMNYLARKMLDDGGFMWANIQEFDHSRIFTFNVKKVWNNGEQLYRLNNYLEPHYCKGIIFDEINRMFNRRANREKQYNDIFIPMINSMVTHRHDGFPRIYFIGQNVLLQDTQIQSILKWKHMVSCKFKYFYVYWRNELKLVRAPHRIIVTHYKKMGTDESDHAIWKKVTMDKIEIDENVLNSYNTFAFSKITEALPLYQKGITYI